VRGEWGGGEGFLTGRGGDDCDELELGDGGSRDVDALGVRTGIGRGEEEAGVADEVIEEGDVDGGESFKLVFGAIRSAKGQTEPEALGAGTGEEGSASEPLGVEGVGQIEVADVADVLYIVEGKRDDSAAEIKKVDNLVVDESRDGQIAGKGLSCGSAHDDLFARGGHVLADCRMGRCREANKLSEE
jgi:hypothetical protein